MVKSRFSGLFFGQIQTTVFVEVGRFLSFLPVRSVTIRALKQFCCLFAATFSAAASILKLHPPSTDFSITSDAAHPRAGRGVPGARCLAVLGTLAACLLLAGCLSAPGMTIRTSLNADEEGGVPMPQWLRAYEPRRDASGKLLEATPQARAIFLPITPDLLRQQRIGRQAGVPDELKALFKAPRAYTIGAGDVLTITVWDHPEIQARPINNSSDSSGVLGVLGVPGYNVSPDGLVQFPYIGTVQVVGLTELQARDKLAAALGKFFKEPQVTLQIQAYRSGRVYVEGEVRNPGLQAINDISTTLPLALGRAGSLLPTADRTGVDLVRNGRTTRIDLQQLADNGIDPAQIALQNGDVVRVLANLDVKIHVLGEVLKAGPQVIRNGRLTLNEALGDAGGVNPGTGDPRQIYVVRSRAAMVEGAAGNTEVYHLDAATAANYALSAGFELKARDVVFVDPVPLVNWNRVLSLLIPTAVAINTSRDATE